VLRRAGEGRLPDPQPPAAAPVPLPAAARPDGLAGAIADLITTGALRPGEKLSEAALGTRFGVGRTLVREALKQLTVGGLVVSERHRGAFVARPSRQEIEQAYAARRLIEGAILEDVACHCTAHDIRRLRRHVADQSAALAAGRRHDLVRLLTEFHLVIAGMGENQVLAGLLADLAARTSLAMMLYDDGGHGCAIDEHARMIDLLASGDAAGARRLMLRHLSTNQGRMQDAAQGRTHRQGDAADK
ncbi:MAG: GntR family transcriptional regulator, partial [Rhodospirillales bacterium]|nr:GntR family transcriptional regulator [Rhodospirillales bacterium]